MKKLALPENFDHKNIDILKQFITETGKIIPARVSGITAPEQRKLTKAVKIASCLLYTSPSPRDAHESRMPSSA